MEGIVNKLRITFSSPPHEVGIEAANTLADALDEFAVNARGLLRANFREIAHDLRILCSSRLRHDVWHMALEYEWMLRHHLLDELHVLFHGVTYSEFITMDIREHRPLTSIYRFYLPAHLYDAYKRYRAGAGRFPRPPTGWRESFRGVTTVNPTPRST